MTIGAADKKVKEEFKSRPALKAKVQASVTSKLTHLPSENVWIDEEKMHLSYYTYDLNELLPLIQDLNIPKSPSDIR